MPTNFERVLIDVPGSQYVTVSHGAQEADRLTSFENFILSGGSLSLGGPSTFNGSLSLLGGGTERRGQRGGHRGVHLGRRQDERLRHVPDFCGQRQPAQPAARR